MQKQRLLITITFSFSVRYLIRTGIIKRLKKFCNPVIALYWREEELIKELIEDGFEVVILPKSNTSLKYNDCRKKINYWFQHKFLQENFKIINAYTEQYQPLNVKILKRLRRRYNLLKNAFIDPEKLLFAREESLLLNQTNLSSQIEWLKHLKLDAILSLTPFHKQEDVLLRAAKSLGLKMITAILSFDNITKRGWIPVIYDKYFVWNVQNKQELIKLYQKIKPENIVVTGAPQFDFYFDKNNLLSQEDWRKENGIDAENNSIIFYAGGAPDLFPNEMQYLIDLLSVIKSGVIINNPIILFRLHPADSLQRWEVAIKPCKNIVIQKSWGDGRSLYSNVTEFDQRNLCSTLAYTDVHISLCSTMTVDGCAFDKPQLAPYYDTVNKRNQNLLRSLFFQIHYKKIMESGGLTLVNHKDDWARIINQSLINPGQLKENRKLLLKTIISYTDGLSNQRVADGIENVLIDNY